MAKQQTTPPAENKPETETEVKPSQQPALVKVGGKVHLVTARGQHVEAVVTNVRKGDMVDLESEAFGVITSSPRDDAGKQPDSWHLPEAE